jgi:Tol biopolymer transport system component
VPVVEGVGRAAAGAGGQAQFSVSASGALVYVPGPARVGRDDLFLFDRTGNAQALHLPPGNYSYPRVSPDGKWLALETTDGKEAAISLYELSGRSSVRRLTFGGNNRLPIWAPDSRHVAFQSDRDGAPGIFWQPVDGGAAERLTTADPGTWHVPESWSQRGDVFLFGVVKGSQTSLWTFSVRDRKGSPFGDVVSMEFPTDAVFSPDGRWVAYQSGEAGSGEATTYVQPYPPTGAKFQIGRGGRPVWSPDGKQLFFIPAPSQFMAVSVTTEPTFAFTQPVAVSRRFGLAPPASPRPYDILPDGRIVAVAPAGQSGGPGATEIRVVVNWFEELKAKVPVSR